MYDIVKNLRNGYYAVFQEWIFENDGKVYSYYPPNKSANTCLLQKVPHKADWKYEEILVVVKDFTGKKNVSLKSIGMDFLYCQNFLFHRNRSKTRKFESQGVDSISRYRVRKRVTNSKLK